MRRPEKAVHPPAGSDPEVFLPLPHLPFQVLLALAEGPLHGWGVIERIREISQGTEHPSSGSLYLAINRLEERGLLEKAEAPEGTDSRRRYVRLTGLGRRVLAAETERLGHLVKLSRRATAAGPGE